MEENVVTADIPALLPCSRQVTDMLLESVIGMHWNQAGANRTCRPLHFSNGVHRALAERVGPGHYVLERTTRWFRYRRRRKYTSDR